MELIKIVPLNFNNKLITQRFNFINYRGFFDIITQYYDKKYFYSLSARFNDQAEMITKIDTIEVQKISQAQGFEIRNCITSSDKKHTFLYRMVTHKNIDSIVIDCISLNNELKTKIKKVLVIPTNKDSELGPFKIDNEGNLIFAGKHRSEVSKTVLYICKVKENSDSLIYTAYDVQASFLYNIDITIDEKKKMYLINGMIQNNGTKNLKYTYSFFTWMVNENLEDVKNGHIISYDINQQLNKPKNIISYYRLGVIKPTGNGYYFPLYEFSNKDNTVSIYRFDDDYKMHFVTKLNAQSEHNIYALINQAYISNLNNELHIIYPNSVKHSTFYSDVIISGSEKIESKTIISNKINYHILTMEGFQLDSHSIIFPCAVDSRMSFAKIEY